jgi:DNA-binding LacI/PurR family transcriptional regulator
MARSRRNRNGEKAQDTGGFPRLDRPANLTARVEQLLRQAIAEGKFPGGRLPTEVELAEQLGVSRETVRLAADTLQHEGLLVKIRRKGTFVRPPQMPEEIRSTGPALLGYLQAGYQAQGQEEGATRMISGLMLQGAIEEAASAGLRLVVQHAAHTQIGKAFQQLHQEQRLQGVIFASYGEAKLLRRVAGLGLPTVLLDHDLPLPSIHSVRDDSFEGARLAVRHLADLGHRRIGLLHWHQGELNPWRLEGYRQGLRDAGLPRRRRWEIPAELTEQGASQAVEDFLSLTPRPTALYCFNNTLARAVIDQLRRRGLDVPAEVSILGGGGEEVPGLTCHQADWYGMGRTAVRVLLRAFSDSPPAPEHHLSAHTLRVGQTTAPPVSGSRPGTD